MAIQFIDDDFVKVRRHQGKAVTLAFGDPVEVLGLTADGKRKRVRVHGLFDGPFEGTVPKATKLRDEGVLKLSMVDVQQGDGLVLETPAGKTVFIDGGDNQLFARHVAQRLRHRGSDKDHPVEIDAILITHGDADHFKGLNKIRESEKLTGRRRRKRLFIHPKRILHNGLVKAPTSVPEEDRLGATVEHQGRLYAVDLYDDPRDAPEAARNAPFKSWIKSLDHWSRGGALDIDFRRVDAGMDPDEVFDFLAEEDIRIELHGPFVEQVPVGGTNKPALRFFGSPPKSAELHLDQGGHEGGKPSVSHTINGHSIAFRMTYGNVRFNLTGDLNKDAMDLMLEHLDADDLQAEIAKAPHHGSHDFDFAALEAMRPVVSIISSGDEHAGKEHIHPRATLMAALGKVMRGKTGLVLCTELAAFFAQQKYSHSRKALAEFFGADERKDKQFTGEDLRKLFAGDPKGGGAEEPAYFFGFKRTNFGIIHIRTDGERVLIFTHSGKEGMKEAYRFSVSAAHQVKFAKEVKTRS